jgi:hypothetical protein
MRSGGSIKDFAISLGSDVMTIVNTLLAQGPGLRGDQLAHRKPLPFCWSGEYRLGRTALQTTMWSFGRTLFKSVVNATLTFQPTFSQFCPASPNSAGFGLSQQ